MSETVTIPSQFNGPPGSGHGGYVAGAFADLVGAAAEVTLRSPPPLDRAMTVTRENSHVFVHDREKLIGEVRTSELKLDVPECPSPDEVDGAVFRFNEFKKDDFHKCFACGAGREEGDGLRLLTGPIEGSEVVAAHWTPHQSFADEHGIVPPRILWSALDCPGVWSIIRDSGVIMLLGRLTAKVEADLPVGTKCTVIGWPIEQRGRKALAGTAIYDQAGRLCGFAKAVWIDVGKRV